MKMNAVLAVSSASVERSFSCLKGERLLKEQNGSVPAQFSL